jgi:hypothetical protein
MAAKPVQDVVKLDHVSKAAILHTINRRYMRRR